MKKFDSIYSAGAIICILLAILQIFVRNPEWGVMNKVTLFATVMLGVYFAMKSKSK